ncbi:tyrosine-type recombinase/integrase [Streptomyces sp. NBC_01525]|uniref:tyrosine-type recombinase/integrase n=1 Tax=unclassified Streptomyces TaxID=2593676 RepID=UPI002001DBF2|nr:tyrosine-type recombinase/integrase [Streptomyces sp. RPA4-5]
MRHTCAPWLVQKGVSLYEVQRLLGHESIQTTQRYAHLQGTRTRPTSEPGSEWKPRSPSRHERPFASVLHGQGRRRLRAS